MTYRQIPYELEQGFFARIRLYLAENRSKPVHEQAFRLRFKYCIFALYSSHDYP
jgi:hypothetical protein